MVALWLALPVAGYAAAIHEAARAGDVAKVRQLIDAGADFRARDEQQQSPMDIAAYNGRIEIVVLLLAKGVDVNAPDMPKGPYNLNVPLSLAAQAGQIDVIKLLIRKNGDTGKPDKKELNALLRLAVQQYGGGHENLVKWLIEQGADVNASFGEPNSGEDGYSLLYLASVRRNDKIVSLLIAHGAKVKDGEDEGPVLLGWAAAEGRVDKLKKLLDQGADVNACLEGAGDEESQCTTPLQLAVSNGRLKAVELLLQHDSQGNSSYFGIAICQHNLAMLKLLAKYEKRTDASDGTDSYALAQTVTCGDKPSLAFLMGRTHRLNYEQITQSLQGLINPYDPYGQTNRSESAQPDQALFTTLYDGDADIKKHVSMLLAPSISAGSDRFAAFLYGKGASLSDEEGSGMLLGAATAGHAGAVELLLKHGVKPDGRSEWGNTPLLRATPYGYTDVAEVLLKYGADVNAKNELFNTPLHMAAARNNVQMATLLINHGARVNAINGDGNTPMHQAARYPAQFDVLKLLLDKKAKVNIKNKRGMTPLHYLAIRNTDYSEYDDAPKEGQQNPYPYVDRNGLAPYQRPDMMQADETERVNAMKLLLSNGADPNIKNMNGDSVLDLERRYSKNKEVLRLLEAREKKETKPTP